MSAFVDEVSINAKGGDGGAGCVAFRREAHVPKGGPDGGDGGDGGDIWLVADHNSASLLSFRDHPHRRADNGTHGSGKSKHGHAGKDLVVAVPVGTVIHNVELKQGKGGQLARAAGTYAQFVGRDGGYAQIRLSSGELRMVRQECMATIGAVSNPDNSNQNFGKAGRMRHMGVRPTVRGVAMNPIDHPHGGGEGRTSGGRHPVTPWGKGTKGNKTRKHKHSDKLIVRSRHAKKGR